MIPPISPIAKATAGLVTMPEGAPIITPPAKVAFRMSSMLNLSLFAVETTNAPKQAAVSEMIVLVTTMDFSKGVAAKYPALNEGQNIHKNRVPIIAKVVLVRVVFTCLICFPSSVRLMKKLTTSP